MTIIRWILLTVFAVGLLAAVAFTVDTILRGRHARRVNHAINRLDKR